MFAERQPGGSGSSRAQGRLTLPQLRRLATRSSLPEDTKTPLAQRLEQRPSLLLVAMLVAVLAAYLTSLEGEFVWDVVPLIVRNPRVHGIDRPWLLFTDAFWSGADASVDLHRFYRPLVLLSYAADWTLHAGNPSGFHLTNVLLHLGCAGLLFRTARELGASALASASVTGCWALQPRLTECVAWIGGRTDVLASLFVLAALVTWRPRRARRWAAAALLLLGLLSKEVAVAGMVAVAALEWRARAQGSPRRWAVRAVVPLGAAALAYTALRVAATGASVMKVSEPRLGRRLAAMLEATGSYAWRFVDAWRPRLQSPLGGPSDLVLVALGGLVVVGLVVLLALLWRRRVRLPKGAVVGGAVALTALAPVLHVLPLPLGVLAADRFLYLPTAGVALALAPSVGRARFGCVGGLLLACSLGWAAALRSTAWADEITLWHESILQTEGESHYPFAMLANLHYRGADYRRALVLYEETLARTRREDDAPEETTLNVVHCLRYLGDYQRAATLLQDRHLRHPRSGGLMLALAKTEIGRGDLAAARQWVSRVHQLDPGHAGLADLRSALAELEGAAGRKVQPGPGETRDTRARLPTADLGRPAAGAYQSARLASLRGRVQEAARLWLVVLSLPKVERARAREGIEYLVRFGPPHLLDRAWSTYAATWPDPETELREAVAYRTRLLARLDGIWSDVEAHLRYARFPP